MDCTAFVLPIGGRPWPLRLTPLGHRTHFHILLWIRDAPVIGRDNPEKVLYWIQERISCRIPDEKSDPELHSLVTRYQMHKCSVYCKRRRKLGSTFVTRCRFQFPRQACEAESLNSVDDSLKSRKKVYNLVSGPKWPTSFLSKILQIIHLQVIKTFHEKCKGM